MTTRHALTLLAAAAVCSCADSASPTAPTIPGATSVDSARGSAAATAETMRRVEEVDGGGNQCVGETCLEYPGGAVHIEASSGSLEGQYRTGQQFQTDIYTFGPDTGLAGRLDLVGSGRLDGGRVSVLSVKKDAAKVLLHLDFPGGIQRIEGSGVPTFRLEADAHCASGQRLTTSVELRLEYLGRTSLTDTHCTAPGPTP